MDTYEGNYMYRVNSASHVRAGIQSFYILTSILFHRIMMIIVKLPAYCVCAGLDGTKLQREMHAAIRDVYLDKEENLIQASAKYDTV